MDKEAQGNSAFKKGNKYLVLKWIDIDKYLNGYEQSELLASVCEKIEAYRSLEGKRVNTYIVVNEDEPYAKDVWMLIEKAKSLEELGYRKLKEKPPLLSDGELENAHQEG